MTSKITEAEDALRMKCSNKSISRSANTGNPAFETRMHKKSPVQHQQEEKRMGEHLSKKMTIDYILSLDTETTEDGVKAFVGNDSFSKSDICKYGQAELVRQLSILEEDGYITQLIHHNYEESDVVLTTPIILRRRILEENK